MSEPSDHGYKQALFEETILQNPWIKQKPSEAQAQALYLVDTPELLWGGAAGGGKSSFLLMGALQFAGMPNYAGIIFRRTYADLSLPGALIARSHEWLDGTKARWVDKEKTWKFPSGSSLSFGYLDGPNDHTRYQSSEFQYCVAGGTPVLMSNDSWKPIEDIDVGDCVATLEGNHFVKKTHRLGRRLVSKIITKYGDVVVSSSHRFLSACGDWVSPTELQSIEYLPFCSTSAKLKGKLAESCKRRECLRMDHLLNCEFSRYTIAGNDRQGFFSSREDGQIDFATFDDSLSKFLRPQESFCRVAISEQSLRLMAMSDDWNEGRGVLWSSKLQDSPIGYLTCRHFCDEQPHPKKVIVQDSTRQQVDAVTQIHQQLHLDDLENTQECIHLEYAHPYTMKVRQSAKAVRLALACIVPAGEEEVFDLTVSSCDSNKGSASHYIVSPGIVVSNCAFDELTQWGNDIQYRYLFSRLRKLVGVNLPVRIRAGSNPGGSGGEWVKQRFITEGKDNNRVFIPARLFDNPYIDQVDYIKQLDNLDPITRAQLLSGDWTVRHKGSMFRREQFQFTDAIPEQMFCCRAWDLAATEKKSADYTVGTLIGRDKKGDFYILDIRRAQLESKDVETLIRQTAVIDGPAVHIFIEQEPGSAGKFLSNWFYTALAGFPLHTAKSTGDKVTRAQAFASQVGAGKVFLPRGAMWLNKWLDEAEAFPIGSFDDQVDSCCLAFNFIASLPVYELPMHQPKYQPAVRIEERKRRIGDRSSQRRRGLFGN